MEKRNHHPETVCIQGGWNPGNGEPRVLPIYQSTTFKYSSSRLLYTSDLFFGIDYHSHLGTRRGGMAVYLSLIHIFQKVQLWKQIVLLEYEADHGVPALGQLEMCIRDRPSGFRRSLCGQRDRPL